MKIRIEGAENRYIKRILLKIIRDTIENIYQTPFRLLGKFGSKQSEK